MTYVEKMNNERSAWANALINDDKGHDLDLDNPPVPGTQALWKGLSILKLIADAPVPLRFGDLSDISKLPKGTLHRILQALIEFHLIRFDDTNQTYLLGSRLFEMAHNVWNQFDLRGAAEPELIRLQKMTGETTRLGIIDRDGVLIVDQKDTDKPLRLENGVGKTLSLHASAMGKVMLAHMPPAKFHALCKHYTLQRFTSHTITNQKTFEQHLDLSKARGYAISEQEQFEGVSSISAPILNSVGHPIGAISIAGGCYSLDSTRLHHLGREVIEAARRISGNVGESFMSISSKQRPALHGSSDWRVVLPSQAFLGEGPVWDPTNQTLTWVDILAPSVHVTNTCSGTSHNYPLPEIVGALVPRQNGGHVAVTQFGYRSVNLETGAVSALATPEGMEGCRFNDGKCDAKGRFWAGTLALDATPGKGKLFCLNIDGNLSTKLEGLHVSNGLGWSQDNTKMYVTDSGKRTIYQFDYDLDSGDITNQQIFATLGEDEGSPDGLAVDCEGGVWSAIWDGWRIIRFSPQGVIDKVIDLPVPRPTSIAFGGDDMRTLYITSARIRLSAKSLADAPLSGSVFAVDTQHRGVSVNAYAG